MRIELTLKTLEQVYQVIDIFYPGLRTSATFIVSFDGMSADLSLSSCSPSVLFVIMTLMSLPQ